MLTPDKLLKHLHDRLEAKERSSVKYYFTITAIYNAGENNRMVIAQKETGLENFDLAIEKAKDLTPDQVEVKIYQNKKDTDRQAEKVMVTFPANAENDSTFNLEKKLEEGIASIKESFSAEGLKGIDSSALGVIQERFGYQTDKLRWENEKALLIRDYNKKIEDLNREIAEKENDLQEERTYTDELEVENKRLDEELADLKENRYTLNGIDLPKLAGKAGIGLVEALASKYSGVLSGLMGLPEGAINNMLASGGKTNAQTPNTENEAVAQIVEFVKQILSQCNEEQAMKFVNLLMLISQNLDTLDIVTKFLQPES